MKNQKNSLAKHISVRLTWHDNGWDGKSCEDPQGNIFCLQDRNLYINKTKVVENKICKTDTSKAKEELKRYQENNRLFLKHSSLAFYCKIHDLKEPDIPKKDIPPCDTFAVFAEKNPFVHTLNPQRQLDKEDKDAIEEIKKEAGNNFQEIRKYISNYYDVIYFPQDYERYIVESASIALFYTVNFPEESRKVVVGFSVIKRKNSDFDTVGQKPSSRTNKSNIGNRWGEIWCFELDEGERFRFPFQEIIKSGNYDLLEKTKNSLVVEPQDNRYFKNRSLFIPKSILLKYLRKLKHAIDILQMDGFKFKEDITVVDRTIQRLSQNYLDFKYPGLAAIGRFLGWKEAYSKYEELINRYEEEYIKNRLFMTIKNRWKKLYIGRNYETDLDLRNLSSVPADFLNLLEDKLVYYPFQSENDIKQIQILIEKGIISTQEAKTNPYSIFERFIPPLDDRSYISFEDIDYGEYNIYKHSNKEDQFYKDKNPYRIRSLIHEYFSVYREEPGFVWISFKDIENYIKDRLSTGLGISEGLDFENILNKHREIFEETLSIDYKNQYLTTKELSKYETYLKSDIEKLISKPKINTEYEIEKFLNEENLEDKDKLKAYIEKILKNPFMLIYGVAGSGKSTLIKLIKKILDNKKENIIVLTPTGKASERLRSENIDSKTIHMFLKDNGFIDPDLYIFRENNKKVEVDNLIVDEVSMIPLDLMYYLLRAVEIGNIKRVIFVGDIKQLPPIGYGYPAKDIYNYLKLYKPDNLIELVQTKRTDDKFIKLATEKIRDGSLKEEDIREFIKDSPDDSKFQIIKFDSYTDLENLIRKIINKENFKKESKETDLQVLSPKKDGYSGTDHINRLVINILNQKEFSWDKTKVIKLRNTYCRENNNNCVESFNGMIGKIVDESKNAYILFGENRKVSFSQEKMGYEYDYAYAITVHKSQGSEFDTVVFILPANIGNLFTRELLYTALTRARKKLYILAEDISMLYKTPDEINRTSKLFLENLVELPDEKNYLYKGKSIKSKLELYLTMILDFSRKNYRYREGECEFVVENSVCIRLPTKNSYRDSINSNNTIQILELLDKEKNIIDVQKMIKKLSINFMDKSSQNKEDFRDRLRKIMEEKFSVYIEPDTNFKVITHNGILTRSISEAILMLVMEHFGIEYMYEESIKINGKTLLPDFYIPSKNTYLEHLGLLDNIYYNQKWQEKKKIYEEGGIKVISLREWDGSQNCCVYTTEKDIHNIDELMNLFIVKVVNTS